MPASASAPVSSAAEAELTRPWSVLKISGLPATSPAPFLERRQTERNVHRVRQPPPKHRARCPVDDRHEIEKAAPDRNIGDVGSPDVVRALDRQIARRR